MFLRIKNCGVSYTLRFQIFSLSQAVTLIERDDSLMVKDLLSESFYFWLRFRNIHFPSGIQSCDSAYCFIMLLLNIYKNDIVLIAIAIEMNDSIY